MWLSSAKDLIDAQTEKESRLKKKHQRINPKQIIVFQPQTQTNKTISNNSDTTSTTTSTSTETKY